ncbi:MAG: DUF4388 domain-containing protein [Cyanobacteriota bacterium]
MGFFENLFGAKLKEELHNLNTKLSGYERNISDLELKLEESNSRNASFNSQISNFKMIEISLGNEILSLKSELSKSKFLSDDLERKNQDLKSKVSNVSSNDSKTSEMSKNYINELNLKNEALTKEVNSSRGDLIFSRNKISELESKIESLNKVNKELKSKTLMLEEEIKNKLIRLSEFEKGSNKNTIEEKEEPKSEGFKGDMSDVNLFEFLQMMIITKKEKLIIFTDLTKNKTGKIFLKEGEIIHAEFEEQNGLEAFLSIVGIRNGRFDVSKWVEPAERTINVPAMNLFMEAARIIDEKEAAIKSLEVDIGKEVFSEKDLHNKSQNIINSIDLKRKTLSGNNKELRDIIVKNMNSSGEHKVEKIRIRKILVVDDSPTIISIMKKYLLSQEYDATTESSSVRALELLKTDSFDLVITDIDMPDINGIELFLWIKENKPNTQVIMMTAFGSDEVREFASSVGALNYFEKPLNMKTVKKVLDEINQNTEGLKGTVEDINIFDFVQMIVLSRKQKLISVSDPITKQKGMLFVSFGEIIHAESGNLKGEDAFYSIMAMKSGTFKDEVWQDAEKTITTKPMKLFMEASKRIDEQIEKLKETQDSTQLLKDNIESKEQNIEENMLVINEYERTVLGLQINKTSKAEAQEILKSYSCNTSINPRLIIYDTLSIILLFAKNDILSEITFGLNYKGKTTKGIKSGDTLEKAASVYGSPTLSSDKVVIWDNIYAFHQGGNIISSMSLR